MNQIVTRIVARFVTNISATQEPIARAVDELTASQEQLTGAIVKLEAISQYGLARNLEPPPRPVHAPMPKPGTRAVRCRPHPNPRSITFSSSPCARAIAARSH